FLEAGRIVMEALEGALLVTRGAQGMTLFRPGSPPVHISSAARDVFDVTGAGDTVSSTFAMALGCGASLEQACRLANYAAGVVVGKVGTSTVAPQEIAIALSGEEEA